MMRWEFDSDLQRWEPAPLITKRSVELLREVHQQVESSTTSQSDTISRSEQIQHLIQAYRQERLVLVLGAGTSIEYNLPSWSSLLQGLLLKTLQKDVNKNNESSISTAEIFNKVFPKSPPIAARYLRLSSENMTFEEDVRDILYANLRDEKDSDLMKEICQLAAAPVRSPNLDSIITYNFDDILENCLARIGVEIPYQIIHDIQIRPKPDVLPIYHVHGFLPRKGKLEPSNKIVLSEDSYHDQYSDIYHWSNLVQINKFRENSCLFIGLSFSDPNLRRLLDIAQKQRGDSADQHFLIRRRYLISDIKEHIKTFQQEEEKYDKDELSSMLYSLIHRFEEKDALSFGVSIIWIDDFHEVPEILRDVRLYYQSGCSRQKCNTYG